jgi:hypothetical protein
VDEVVRGALEDAVEKLLESAQGGGFAGLVWAVDQMQARRAFIQA